MGTKILVHKLGSLCKISLFIIIASALSTSGYAQCFLDDGYPIVDPCFTGVHYKKHYKRHHHRHHYRHHHHRRHVNWSSVSVYSIGGCGGCADCCTAWTPGYTVYTTLPDYSYGCNYGCDWSAGNYDPPNGSPYTDDINADYNMTY